MIKTKVLLLCVIPYTFRNLVKKEVMNIEKNAFHHHHYVIILLYLKYDIHNMKYKNSKRNDYICYIDRKLCN